MGNKKPYSTSVNWEANLGFSLLGQGKSEGLVLIDLEETKAKVGAKSDSVIYEWIKSRGFPAPVKGSRRFARWVLGEVDAWILARIKERDEAAKQRIAA